MAEQPGADRSKQQLDRLRVPLLRLHKSLLNAERLSYEKEHGRIQNNGALLQLVIGDPWFAWLRPLSGLIVMIDEHLEAEEAPPAGAGQDLLRQVRSMVEPRDDQPERKTKYEAALQHHPDVVIAHIEVMRALAG